MLPLERDRTGATDIGINFKRLMGRSTVHERRGSGLSSRREPPSTRTRKYAKKYKRVQQPTPIPQSARWNIFRTRQLDIICNSRSKCIYQVARHSWPSPEFFFGYISFYR